MVSIWWAQSSRAQTSRSQYSRSQFSWDQFSGHRFCQTTLCRRSGKTPRIEISVFCLCHIWASLQNSPLACLVNGYLVQSLSGGGAMIGRRVEQFSVGENWTKVVDTKKKKENCSRDFALKKSHEGSPPAFSVREGKSYFTSTPWL